MTTARQFLLSVAAVLSCTVLAYWLYMRVLMGKEVTAYAIELEHFIFVNSLRLFYFLLAGMDLLFATMLVLLWPGERNNRILVGCSLVTFIVLALVVLEVPAPRMH